MQNHSIEIYTEIEHLDSDISELILKCANETLNHLNINFDCHIDITITDNNQIHKINLEHRDKDQPTDVLSFPLNDFKNGVLNDDLELVKDPDTNLVPLGDMIISYDKVVEQALEFDHSKNREFAFLTVHSVLHLTGFDHEQNDDDCKLMRNFEKEILSKLEIYR